MAYEVNCTSCHVRLFVDDEPGNASYLCPRCLKEAPHATASTQAATGSPPVGTVHAIKAATFTKAPGPSVLSETKPSGWFSYFVVLAITLLVGLIVVTAAKFNQRSIPEAFEVPAVGTLIVLSALILYPIVWAVLQGIWPAPHDRDKILRWITLIVLFALFGPITAYMVILAVCIVGTIVIQYP